MEEGEGGREEKGSLRNLVRNQGVGNIGMTPMCLSFKGEAERDAIQRLTTTGGNLVAETADPGGRCATEPKTATASSSTKTSSMRLQAEYTN